MNKKSIILTLAFGLAYLWVGGIFMTVFFRLYAYYDEIQVTYISDALYYLMQAAGVFSFSALIRNKSFAAHKLIADACLIVITLFFGIIAMYADNPIGILVSGALMNISIGGLMSSYLLRISEALPMNQRAKCFAFAYAIGSIGTYILSLPSGGNALSMDYINGVYVVLALIAVALTILFDRRYSSSEDTSEQTTDNPVILQGQKKYASLLLMALIPFFFMVINSFGYHFEQSNTSEINIIFTRAFYSIGLIAAGIITDKKRQLGAICAFLSLSFPLICLSFTGNPEFTFVSSILSYIFLGFINVYSVILFIDYVDICPRKAYLSVYGYGISRIGTAVGTTAGILLEKYQVLLICITLVLYAICGLIFFTYLNIHSNRTVLTETPAERQDRVLREYAAQYGFNGKQTEVLRLLLEGYPNGEIAEKLFLAESTVKYHVKNILKITGMKNRNALIADYTAQNQTGRG